jgi:hypothetical protein
LLFILACAAATTQPAPAQDSSLGGCPEGTERGYARVVRSAPLLEYLTDAQFAVAQPGDVFRMCRLNSRYAIVTLMGRGAGFRIRKSAVEVVLSLPPVDFRAEEFTRLACGIAQIQGAAPGLDAQNRALLDFARANHITFPMIIQIREEALNRGIYSMPGRCGA